MMLPSPHALPSNAQQQQGVALLTILLLVVSITVVAGAMLASQKIAIRQSGLLFEQDQLLHDITAGRQLAVALITADSKLNDTDSNQDIWAQPLPPYPMGTHVISIEMTDEASRFNINNLYHDGQVDVAALTTFKRLLAQVGLEEGVAVAVLDWQDPDNTVFEDSADEATIYQSNASGAMSAASMRALPNQPFYSVEQLAEVDGISAEALTLLRPYLTAVPYYLPVNVNSAVPEVLAAMVDGATPEQMQSLISTRESVVIDNLESLWQLAPFNRLPEEERSALTPLLAVDSQAFSALIAATDAAEASFGQSPRQRFATVMISKVTASETGVNNGNERNARPDPQAGQNNTNSERANGDKVVKAFAQRLWPYRPTNYQ